MRAPSFSTYICEAGPWQLRDVAGSRKLTCHTETTASVGTIRRYPIAGRMPHRLTRARWPQSRSSTRRWQPRSSAGRRARDSSSIEWILLRDETLLCLSASPRSGRESHAQRRRKGAFVLPFKHFWAKERVSTTPKFTGCCRAMQSILMEKAVTEAQRKVAKFRRQESGLCNRGCLNAGSIT